MTKPPHCVHWAVVGRKGKDPWANAPPQVYEDLVTPAMVADALNRSAAEACVEARAPSPTLRFQWPTLALDVPHLYTMDPITRELAETDWLVLQQTFKLGDARVGLRTVDVVSVTGLERLAATYETTISRVHGCIERRSVALAEMAADQHSRSLRERTSVVRFD